mmetsp:Transcript_65582/g.147987  ORF Transcript_65582/g.147987 Transcript_65582/m.147987 type:complete len:105 (+) Transcript_65582:46-360(+)
MFKALFKIAFVRYYWWINVAGFALAVFDKFVAVTYKAFGLRRISEGTLLILASLGAFPGESLAFVLFDHKTRKKSFRHSFVFATACHLLLYFVAWQFGLMRLFF